MSLLLIERAVLECIGRNSKEVITISDETGIKVTVVEKILKNFLTGGVVQKLTDHYSVNIDILLCHQSDKDLVKVEVQDVLSSASNVHFSEENESSELKLKKVFISKSEFQYFKSMWRNMDEYLKRISSESKDTKVKDQTVVYWGWANYNKMIDQYMGL